MSDQKDRYGDKIHDLEAAREDQWAHQEDEKLLQALRDKRQGRALKCPECDGLLALVTEAGLEALQCPAGHGAWLADTVLARLRAGARP